MPKVLNASALRLKPNVLPPNAVYIGRRTRNGWRASKWGNRLRPGRDGTHKEICQISQLDMRSATVSSGIAGATRARSGLLVRARTVPRRRAGRNGESLATLAVLWLRLSAGAPDPCACDPTC